MKKNLEKGFEGIIIIFLAISIIITLFGKTTVEAKTKTIEGTRIMNLTQNIKGKEYYIGCRVDGCSKHKGKIKYSEKPCSSGSDLKNIYVEKKGENGKTYWKTLDELKFTSVQGGCINKNILLLSFVDKGKNEKGDLTALVKINIKSKKVVKVELVKGAIEQNIDTLGHSNDFTYLNGKYYGAWYQENGKEDYSNKIGEIGAKLKNNGVVGKLDNGAGAAVFGISVYDKKNDVFAMGIRQKNKINGKLERYIATYKSKKTNDGIRYVQQNKIISLKQNNDYNVPQCMEIYNKKIYLVKYFHNGKDKGKKIKKIEKRVRNKNNIVEVYGFNGKLKKEYIIKNPKSIYVTNEIANNNSGTKTVKIKKSLKNMKWEIECLAHYKNDKFYYVMYKPSKLHENEMGKQAYLYSVNFK